MIALKGLKNSKKYSGIDAKHMINRFPLFQL